MKISKEIQQTLINNNSTKQTEFASKKNSTTTSNLAEKKESFNSISIFNNSSKSNLDASFSKREAKVIS